MSSDLAKTSSSLFAVSLELVYHVVLLSVTIIPVSCTVLVAGISWFLGTLAVSLTTSVP